MDFVQERNLTFVSFYLGIQTSYFTPIGEECCFMRGYLILCNIWQYWVSTNMNFTSVESLRCLKLSFVKFCTKWIGVDNTE